MKKLFKIIAAALMLAAGGAQAATYTWTGTTDTNWSTAANWGGTAPVNNSGLIFAGTLNPNTYNPTAGRTYTNIYFSNTGNGEAFTLSGTSITLGAGGISNAAVSSGSITDIINLDLSLANANKTFEANTGHNLTINGAISSSGVNGGVIKTGGGILKLSGANTYTGATTINAGTLQLGAANAISTTGKLTVANGTLDLNNYNQSINAPGGIGALALGTVDGGNAEIKTGTGTLTLTSSATLGAIQYSASGAAYNPGAAVISGNLNYNSGNSNFVLTVYNSTATDEELTISANIGRTGTTTGGTFYKNGDGTLVLSGLNTFNAAGLRVDMGTMVLAANALKGQNGSLGNNTADISVGWATVASDAALLLKQGVSIDRKITATTYTNGASYLRTIGGVNTSGNATFSGNVVMSDHLRLTSAAGGNVNFNGVISGSSNLTKIGTGTVTLNGTNTYTGTTTVNSGTLVINGSLTNTAGAVTIDAGATLMGSGIIGSATTVNGNLKPGNSPGTLTFNAALTLGSASTSSFEIVSTSSFDVLKNDGNDTITFNDGATIVFDTTGYTVNVGDSFQILSNWTGRAGTLGNLVFAGTDLGGGKSLDTSNFLSTGIVTVIPEPATIGMLGLGALVTLMIRRMRTA